jgi:hypothetical protein
MHALIVTIAVLVGVGAQLLSQYVFFKNKSVTFQHGAAILAIVVCVVGLNLLVYLMQH